MDAAGGLRSKLSETAGKTVDQRKSDKKKLFFF